MLTRLKVVACATAHAPKLAAASARNEPARVNPFE